MRELGRKGGKARRQSVDPERVPASLREELRTLDPAIVRGAIEQALAGGNESARVSAAKLLADIDAFRKDDDREDRKAAMAKAGAEARAHLARELARRADHREHRRVRELVAELTRHLEAQAASEAPRRRRRRCRHRAGRGDPCGARADGPDRVPIARRGAGRAEGAGETERPPRGARHPAPVSQRRIPGLDPAVQERAGLTDRQAECLELHVRGASLRWIAREPSDHSNRRQDSRACERCGSTT